MAPSRLVYLVTEDWYFVAHRLPMARAAKRAGYEVHVATRVREHGAAIKAEGFHLHPIDWRRGSVNPFSFLITAAAVRRLYRELRPALVHHVALQASVTGSLARLGLGTPQINAFVGLGYVFTSDALKARLARAILSPLLPRLIGGTHSTVLVENPDDRAVFISLGVDPARIAVFPGSGVDVDRFRPMPEPDGAITIAFAGRMLGDKGVRTLVAAHEILAQRGASVRLLLAGTPDPANPTSIPTYEIETWCRRAGIIWRGQVADVRTVWADAHIAVLASRREGSPISLMEAAACGRPLIATDVPGCREVARQDVNALLVPVDNPTLLANAIERLARDAELRRRFGAAGRTIVENEFSSERVGRDIVALYDRLVSPTKSTPV